jgi:hypothetical protein
MKNPRMTATEIQRRMKPKSKHTSAMSEVFLAPLIKRAEELLKLKNISRYKVQE